MNRTLNIAHHLKIIDHNEPNGIKKLNSDNCMITKCALILNLFLKKITKFICTEQIQTPEAQ